MKKNVLLLLGAMLFSLSGAFAADVTVQDAQSVALNFFKITLGTRAPRNLAVTLKYTRTESDNTVDFYVFEMASAKGFVIVSATDNDEPIIGYSTESYFPTDISKIGLNEVLNRWSTELHYVKQHNTIATATAPSHWTSLRMGIPITTEKSSVTPFCQTTWDQNTEYSSGPNLYNNYCPGGTGQNQAVTGCVATAMAQIMKYWSYPTTGTSSSSYNDSQNQGYTSNYGVLSFNYGATTFDWANMPVPGLTNTSSTTQIDAVGTIMYAAGVSVDMDYSPNGSGAIVMTAEAGGGANPPCAQNSYVQYFGYQNIIKGIGLTGTSSGADYILSSTAFADSIEADLAAGHLVQIEGTDPQNGGHTWVCDGYETSPSVMFHMNWGWSGYADGYFAFTNLDPNDGQQLSFSQDIGALIHIVPPVPPNHLVEQATAQLSAVCPGSQTQLTATTHTNATYSWTPTTALNNANISSPVASPTSTTTYTVTVDSAGITATGSVTITVHAAPSAVLGNSSNPSCFGSSNGSITVSGSGGTPGYSYKWSNNETTATATNLTQGTYTVTITDANTCSGTVSKTLTQPASALSASTTNVSNATCGQSNGSIMVSVSGGTTGYTYLWSNGATTATASNLSGASYHVTVTDAHSCSTTVSATITSSGTLNLVTSATNANCFGSTTGSASATVSGNAGNVNYIWSNGATTSSIQNVGAATYTLTISDGSGCSATSSKTVGQPSAITASVHTTNSGCGNSNTGTAVLTVSGGTSGYAYLWSNGQTGSSISSLTSGTYDVTITDAHNCSTTADAVVGTASPLSLAASSTNETCYGDQTGAANVNVSNGVTPYSYVWSNGATTASLSNVAAGNYNVTITDANSCSSTTSVAVTQPDQMQVTTTETNATGVQDNGTATVGSVVNGTGPYTYLWNNGATSQTITGLGAGTYTVTVTDLHGCSQTASDFVNVSTGINAISNTISFSIYPNPAHSYVLVQLNNFNTPTTVSLKNVLGQTVITQAITAQQTQLDLNSLSNGVYLIELIQGEKTAVKQLVIVK